MRRVLHEVYICIFEWRTAVSFKWTLFIYNIIYCDSKTDESNVQTKVYFSSLRIQPTGMLHCGAQWKLILKDSSVYWAVVYIVWSWWVWWTWDVRSSGKQVFISSGSVLILRVAEISKVCIWKWWTMWLFK